jgi:hypothetical protein
MKPGVQNPKCRIVVSRDRNQLVIRYDSTLQPNKYSMLRDRWRDDVAL